MSNASAIGAVSETLAHVVREAIGAVVDSPSVSIGRPEELSGNQADSPRVNLFLYATRPNPARRNFDLPHRNAQGAITEQPELALDLHYLLSFYGAEDDLVPERLAGATLGALYREPTLTRDRIRTAVSDALVTDPTSFLAEADLAEQLELIRVSPVDLTIEEMSNLWSTFQSAYRVSAAVEVSVVVIEPSVDVPTGPPVMSRSLFVVPSIRPVVTSVEPQLVDFAPGARVELVGHDLGGEGMVVEFGRFRVAAPAAGPTRIRTSLPVGLTAGVHAVRAIRTLPMGDPPRDRDVAESNAAVIMIRPQVTAAAFVAGPQPTVTVQVDPPVRPGQDIALLISEAGPPPDREAISQKIETTVEAPAAALSFGPIDVPSGDYLIRLRVDNAESALQLLADGSLTGPVVTVP